MDSTLPIIMRMYDAYKQIVGISMGLPKRWHYGLGISLEQTVLSCFSELIMAKNAPKALKAGYLIRASSHLEIVRFKLRLLLEFALVNETKIFQVQAILADVGRMMGGWLKSVQSM